MAQHIEAVHMKPKSVATVPVIQQPKSVVTSGPSKETETLPVTQQAASRQPKSVVTSGPSKETETLPVTQQATSQQTKSVVTSVPSIETETLPVTQHQICRTLLGSLVICLVH